MEVGIVRRIDELGRIVIPKEIRKKLRIKEGDSLEISVKEDNILLKKYSLINKMEVLAQNMTDTVYSIIKKNIIVTDNDKVVACTGDLKKDYLNKNISEFLERAIKRRENLLEKHEKELAITSDKKEKGTYVITTVIINGDAVGLVIIFDNKEKIDEYDYNISQIISKFLSKYLED